MTNQNLTIINVNLIHSKYLVYTSNFYCAFFGGELYEK